MTEAMAWEPEPTSPEEPVLLPDSAVEAFVIGLADPSRASAVVTSLLEQRGDAIYADLVCSLANLRFPHAEARRLWDELLAHRGQLQAQLGRDVGVRVAALDFFLNVRGELASQRVLEPEDLERLQRLATLDPLTTLGNRRLLKQKLAEELDRSRRYHIEFVVALFDIDDLKSVNEARGHSAGDAILKRLARLIKASIRKSDTAARLAGEEFAILMPETVKRGGSIQAERIRGRIEKEFADVPLTVSGGVASFPADGADERTLFLFAERALHRAKSEGKNRVRQAPIQRRAFPRLDDSLRVNLSTLGPAEPPAADVSLGGVAIRVDKAIPVSILVKGELRIRDKSLAFVARVVYVDEVVPGQYELGLEFNEIATDQRLLLMAHAT